MGFIVRYSANDGARHQITVRCLQCFARYITDESATFFSGQYRTPFRVSRPCPHPCLMRWRGEPRRSASFSYGVTTWIPRNMSDSLGVVMMLLKVCHLRWTPGGSSDRIIR